MPMPVPTHRPRTLRSTTDPRRIVVALAAVLLGALFALGAPRPAVAQATPAPPAGGEAAASAAVRGNVEAWLQGRYKVDGVRRAPVPGMWEVQIGTDLIYVDDKGLHAFVEGQLIELKTNRNYTRERVDELLTIRFDDLPLALAIKQVNGKGTRRLAVFEDPNCGHCRTLRRELVNVPDLTIYTFPLPILAADSEQKVRQAWCAKDRVKAWNDLMIAGKVPDNKGDCDVPVQRITELGRKLKVTGTPTLFFANGKRVPGGVPGPQLLQLIEQNSKT